MFFCTTHTTFVKIMLKLFIFSIGKVCVYLCLAQPINLSAVKKL